MSFEIKEKDLLARIGKLETRSGTLETPLLFPVVNPAIQPVSPRKIREKFGFTALITNAYILRKRFGNEVTKKGLHEFIDFSGVLMTDSGAYQTLIYGDIDVSPAEIVRYQEDMGTDIATILDIPTGWKVSREQAEKTVNETLKRAKDFFKTKTRNDVLWTGPVQGGKYLDLVARSAEKMAKLPFQIHALGSPTEVMERYRFDVLVDMIMIAKMNLPPDRPLHLFGAGHPFMFSLAVALGCDSFDSAAYALYAKEDRYLTENGTRRLGELEYFPCDCPNCLRAVPSSVTQLPEVERRAFLAEHNLYTCAVELRTIKQAIKEGRLWEHLEMRAHAHPALYQALKKLSEYEEFIERHAPATKDCGLFYYGSAGLSRPEVVHYRKRMQQRYLPPGNARTLLLLPSTHNKPFHKSKQYAWIAEKFLKDRGSTHICFYSAPFGVVPVELDEVYPLSQNETANPPDNETAIYVADRVAEYVKRSRYTRIVLFDDPENWRKRVSSSLRKVCLQKRAEFEIHSIGSTAKGET